MVNEVYKSVNYNVTAQYTDRMLCATGAHGIITLSSTVADACQGDSGGPLVKAVIGIFEYLTIRNI